MRGPFLAGRFEHTLDEKGRVTVPSRYRKHFEGGAFLVPDPHGEQCIRVYHPESWADYDEKFIEPLDEFGDPEASFRIGDLYESIHQVTPDKQGRILIPQFWIDELKLSGKVWITGHRDHLQIWKPETHQRRREERRRREQRSRGEGDAP